MATLVVLCSHNGERFVREQVASIRRQTVPVDAIHAFDFGSTDGTRRILEEIAADGHAPPLHVHGHADAPGASLSFFRAFAEIATIAAPSDCILLADQDDVWLEHKVERMQSRFARELAVQANAMVLAFHDVSIVDRQLRAMTRTYYTGNPFSIPRDLSTDRLLLANPVVGHTIATSGALLKAVSESISRGEYCMHDWALILVASRIGRVSYEPDVLSLYRQHDANVLGAFGRRRPLEIVGRTLRFARQATRQAIAFERDIDRILQEQSYAGFPVNRPRVDRWLSFVASRMPFAAPILLSFLALTRGPTWQRRALSAAILLSAVTAPFLGGTDR